MEKDDGLTCRYLQPTLVNRIQLPDIDEKTLTKLPYWKAWLYRTLKEIEDERSD
jgi:hypothetical protein